jgi:hypothetical protein
LVGREKVSGGAALRRLSAVEMPTRGTSMMWSLNEDDEEALVVESPISFI